MNLPSRGCLPLRQRAAKTSRRLCCIKRQIFLKPRLLTSAHSSRLCLAKSRNFRLPMRTSALPRSLPKPKHSLPSTLTGKTSCTSPALRRPRLCCRCWPPACFWPVWCWPGGLLVAGGTALGAVSGACALGAVLAPHFGVYRWRFAARGTRLAFSIGAGLLLLCAAACAFFASLTALLPMWAVLGAAALVFGRSRAGAAHCEAHGL